MMFATDAELDKLASHKSDIGCRKQLKEAADKYVPCGSHVNIVWTLQMAEEDGYLRPDIVLTVVCINQGILFFRKPLEEVRQIVQDITPQRKAKIPSKVLTRMTAIRLNKLKGYIREHNASAQAHYKWQLNMSNNGAASVPTPPVQFEMPDLRTIEQARNFLQSYNGNMQYYVNKLKKEMERDIFSRPELTDSDVSFAMDLVIMGTVAEE
jgi:hypothetical protein